MGSCLSKIYDDQGEYLELCKKLNVSPTSERNFYPHFEELKSKTEKK
jgi:hypothetical protein